LVEVLDGRGNTTPLRVDSVTGRASRYSGGGYAVLQQLMSDVSGQPFDRFMDDAVLSPIGMRDSTFRQPPPPGLAARPARAHFEDRSAVPRRWHVYPAAAAAGLWTTATDLAKLIVEVQR